MQHRFGWAYIGCGGIARITAKEVLESGQGKIVSVWNRTQSRAEEFVREFGGIAYITPQEAINAPGVDGVYIAVTANLHEEYMRLCIESRKPVLCEKPFTVNAQQANSVLKYAQENGVYVSEAMWTWFNATAKQVKYWVHSGLLGKISRVRCTYSFPMILSPYKKPRHTSPELIGGALLDTGVYGIRYCYELFGMPKGIICQGRLLDGIDLGETITMDYDGFQADFIFSRDQNHGETFEIVGENGTISVPMYHCARKAVMKGDVCGKVKDKHLLYGTMFSEIAGEIRSGNPNPVTISHKSTIDVMHIMDICRHQMGLKYPCETV